MSRIYFAEFAGREWKFSYVRGDIDSRQVAPIDVEIVRKWNVTGSQVDPEIAPHLFKLCFIHNSWLHRLGLLASVLVVVSLFQQDLSPDEFDSLLKVFEPLLMVIDASLESEYEASIFTTRGILRRNGIDKGRQVSIEGLNVRLQIGRSSVQRRRVESKIELSDDRSSNSFHETLGIAFRVQRELPFVTT